MLTGEIRSQIDRIWDAFWSGGISNPLEVIEQITYLLFLKRLELPAGPHWSSCTAPRNVRVS
jgi:HsdM N-terminal domain